MQSKIMKGLVTVTVSAAALVLAGVTQAAGVPGQGTWESTLLGRDIGGHAVDASSDSAVFLYDTTLDITWLRDARYADSSGYMPGAYMGWDTARSWVNTLAIGAYSGWRLPTLKPVNGSSFQYNWSNNGSADYGGAKTGTGWGVASEIGHLFYVTLGNIGLCTPNDASPDSCDEQPGWGLTNTGTFQNLWPDNYWFGLENAQYPNIAWSFSTDGGLQEGFDKEAGLSVLAVRPGDVVTVPEPQAYALLLLGLTGLALARRRRSH